jgi:methyl-accepting chemotaxis protein
MFTDMFKNLRIGVRLGLGFGAVLILMSLLALIAFTKLAQLNQEIDHMVNDRFPKTVWANDVIEQVNIIARVTTNTSRR